VFPITTVIVMELERRRGSAKDNELFEAVREILKSSRGELSQTEFNKALMKLELRGIVRVEPLRKNVKIVYLVSGNKRHS